MQQRFEVEVLLLQKTHSYQKTQYFFQLFCTKSICCRNSAILQPLASKGGCSHCNSNSNTQRGQRSSPFRSAALQQRKTDGRETQEAAIQSGESPSARLRSIARSVARRQEQREHLSTFLHARVICTERERKSLCLMKGHHTSPADTINASSSSSTSSSTDCWHCSLVSYQVSCWKRFSAVLLVICIHGQEPFLTIYYSRIYYYRLAQK